MANFPGRGTVNNAGIDGFLGIVDGGHGIVDRLKEGAPHGRVTNGLHRVVKKLKTKPKTKTKAKCKVAVKTNNTHTKQFTRKA